MGEKNQSNFWVYLLTTSSLIKNMYNMSAISVVGDHGQNDLDQIIDHFIEITRLYAYRHAYIKNMLNV